MDNDGAVGDRAAGSAPAGGAARRRRWWYLLFVVQLAAIVWPPLYNRIEPMWARHPVLLLVPVPVADRRRRAHRHRLLRDREEPERSGRGLAGGTPRGPRAMRRKDRSPPCDAPAGRIEGALGDSGVGNQLDGADRLHAAVRLHHLARLRRRALAPRRSRPAARMGPGRPALRHADHLVPARRRSLHRLHLHRRAGARLRRRRDRASSPCPTRSIIYPFLFVVFPRLWSVAHKHGYITAADFVRGRFGNRWLALAVALTGIVATMPYIALQLVGLEVVIAALGVPAPGLVGDLPLIIAFVILAAFTYTSGLRAPAADRDRQGPADLHHGACAVIFVVPMQLGGFGKIFAAVPPSQAAAARRRPGHAPAPTAPMRRWRSARRWRCSSIRTRSPAS